MCLPAHDMMSVYYSTVLVIIESYADRIQRAEDVKVSVKNY